MRSQHYESALAREGLGFSYLEKVDLKEEIDRAASLRNQSRLGTGVDKELVEAYTLAVRRGDEMPPFVLCKRGPRDKKYVLADGVQRREALEKAGRKYHDAYVLETHDEQVIDRVTWTFNNIVNGKRLSQEECLLHALTFVEKYGMAVKEAAREWAVPMWKLGQRLRLAQTRRVLDRHNVRRPPALSDDALERLHVLTQAGEDVLVMAVRVAGEAGMSGPEADELAGLVGKAPDHEKKVRAIEEFAQSEAFREKKAESRGGAIKRTRPQPRERLASLVKQANDLLARFPDRKAFRPRQSEYKQRRQEAQELCESLALLYGLGAAYKEMA